MESKTVNCQNCKNDFIIEPDDFSFYEKIKVPPPTFCPECRLQRRLMFMNERCFHRRNCGLCGTNLISIFENEKIPVVYCLPCWWSDKWNTADYYLDYDSKKNFFEQIKELQQITPFMEKVNNYATLINSKYVNHAGSLKDCYFVFNADFNENVYFSSVIERVKDSAECTMMNKTELSYECIGGDGSKIYFSENCPSSINVWYSKDCIGCNDCFGCVNLNKKNYHIYNRPYSKEEYFKEVEKMELDKYSSHQKIQENIYSLWNKFPRRFTYGRMNKDVTGEYVYNSKNCKKCYQAVTMEDCSYCQFVTLPTFKDSIDVTNWGNGVELCIDSINCGEGSSNLKYCAMTWANVQNIEYSFFVLNSKDCFGCVNLRNKQYCILNKQYTKEEYEKLKEKIIEDMKVNPYIDKIGRRFSYGEFFPYELSLYSYNETLAFQFFHLKEEEIKEKGFYYFNPNKYDYSKTIEFKDIPDSIKDISKEFLKEVLQCDCGKFYKIIEGEFGLLKRFNLPIPRKCPDCRHMRRINRMNPPKFWHRSCMKEGCTNEFETSYSPERPEIIYCEKCYQKEVY